MDHKAEAEKIYNRLQALVSDNREDRKAGIAISPGAFRRVQQQYDWFNRKPSKKQLDDLKAIERQLDIWMHMAANQVTLEEAEMAI